MKDYIDWDAFNRAADRYDRETDRIIDERYGDDENDNFSDSQEKSQNE